jgi:hypothetical protein
MFLKLRVMKRFGNVMFECAQPREGCRQRYLHSPCPSTDRASARNAHSQNDRTASVVVISPSQCERVKVTAG